jgi:hypothetical protein
MSRVKLSCPSVLCVMDDNFDLLEIKKSISKKAKSEIVLSRTWAMLSMANLRPQTDLLPQAEEGRSSIEQVIWMYLRELSRMRDM